MLRLGFTTLLAIATLNPSSASGNEAFDYCLANPDQCALSVLHLSDGWERHLNADRLQVTASTFKVFSLVVYAQAVVDGKLDPERMVSKEEWARFWVGLDGGSLEDSWEELGRPDQVSVDQMMRAMIKHSDNASPDWLLDELGAGYFKRVLEKYVEGYHDTPESIGATFVTWVGNPDEPGVGPRVLEEYSGIDALGFKKEVGALFRRLGDEAFTARAREAACWAAPWEPAVAPGCVQVGDLTTSEVRQLIGGYFLQSTSRTYARLLAGILEETLLPPAVQEVVVRHLEWQLEIPEVAALATRLGAKGGSLSPQNICNWVAYGDFRASGDRIVLSLFMHDVPVEMTCDADIKPFELFEALALEAGFQEEVMARIPPETARPELIARVETLKHKSRKKGDLVKTRVRVANIGTADAEGPFEVWLVASDDNRADRRDTTLEKWVIPFLGAGESTSVRFKKSRLEDLEGKYLIVRVDRKNEVDESGEDNNRPWQRLR